MTRFDAQVHPRPSEISDLTDRVSNFLERAGVDVRTTHHAAMLLEELLTNLGTHGRAADQSATVGISIESHRVLVEVIDTGPHFDPRSTPDPDVSAPVEDRAIGGLGLFLMRKLASEVSYVRSDGRNRTAFAVARS